MNEVAIPAPRAAKALLDDASLRRVLTLLDCDGEEARVIGGALRNALLGQPVLECDIATTAKPEAVTARAEAAGLRAIPTGIAHGTVTLLVDGKTFEVTTLREDIETDGRHAKVRFARDFAADAQRRDFTINALSMSRDGMLYDYVGGLEDLRARHLRFIGDPTARIREDYLRILRFFRFAADYSEGPLDTDALHAAMEERGGLAQLSRERIRTELFKLLAARRAGEITRAFSETGLLGPLLASAPWPARLDNLLALSAGETPDALLRLAALCVNLPEDAERLREMLRLSNQEHQRLERCAEALMTLHGFDTPPGSQTLVRLLFCHGRQGMIDALSLVGAQAGPKVFQPWRDAIAYVHATEEPKMPFSGADLMARGITNGRAIGAALKDLQQRWMDEGFPKDPHRLAQLLEAAVSTGRRAQDRAQ
ncbi:MAG TPA: CCA tRNA nucleotidyltransferase [Methylovirgula sp.]